MVIFKTRFDISALICTDNEIFYVNNSALYRRFCPTFLIYHLSISPLFMTVICLAPWLGTHIGLHIHVPCTWNHVESVKCSVVSIHDVELTCSTVSG